MRKHTNPIDEWLAGAFGAIFPAIPKPDPLGNQCDGCQAGMPVVNGMHRNAKGHGHMVCARKHYEFSEMDADETNHGICAQGDCDE